MKTVNGNKAFIINEAREGRIAVGEVVFSEVNNCKYRIERVTNHQGEWIGVQEVA